MTWDEASRALRRLLAGVAVAVVVAALGGSAFYLLILRDLPDLERVEDYRPLLTSRVLDRNGHPIGEFYEERRRLTPIEEIPPHMIHAIVAAEDDAFFEHRGLDYGSILRAAWVNFWAGRTRQGASTITQQVAKSLLLTPERSYRRKLRDMILAHRIEQRLAKDEILFLYLNQIYFGRGAYGIADAALSYFGKSVSELTPSECALLAGLPQRPSEYSPFVDPEAAERRRQYVLRRMHEVGYLDEAAYEQALADLPVLAPASLGEDFDVAAYFTEEVRRYLFERLGGETVLRGGITVETTLDIELQRAATAAVRDGLTALDRRLGYRGPERRVAPDAIASLLPELAERNGWDPAEAGDPPPLPADRDLYGVVTRVAPESQTARVAFAPGVEAVVSLEDVRWARTPNPAQREHPVPSIDRVFAPGDVTAFRLRPPDPDAEPAGSALPRVAIAQEPVVQGALLSFDVETGDVLALVGGYDFEKSEFNRAIQALRQPGSAFKPIVYAAALQRDYSPVSILWDRPFVSRDDESGLDWRPQNYGRKFLGQITLREALARSVNNATIHLANDLGVRSVIAEARRLGIESPLAPDLSLALGSSSVSLLELLRAYAVFPSQGRLLRPRFISRVLDRDGNVLIEDVALGDSPEAAEPDGDGIDADEAGDARLQLAAGNRLEAEAPLDGEPSNGRDTVGIDAVPPGHVISPTLAYLMTDLLHGVVEDPRGTGGRARALRHPVGGKTGTTNEQADAWFIGFSPDIATGVWVGFDQKRVLGRGEAGSTAALPIWIDYMRVALARRPVRDFPVPPDIVFARIDRGTGLLADATSESTYFQAFYAGTEPTQTSAQALAASESDRLLRLDPF
ncbi:MAG: PBP1A family penicillin-binding protein [Deltaproteobacteria bacterium]|nr:MAG: PBP1A family penicillin-binding protein [Deltaproteobacteria bacterium]